MLHILHLSLFSPTFSLGPFHTENLFQNLFHQQNFEINSLCERGLKPFCYPSTPTVNSSIVIRMPPVFTWSNHVVLSSLGCPFTKSTADAFVQVYKRWLQVAPTKLLQWQIGRPPSTEHCLSTSAMSTVMPKASITTVRIKPILYIASVSSKINSLLWQQ